MSSMENKLRQLPSVNILLGRPEIESLKADFPHDLLVGLIRENLEACRSAVFRGHNPPSVEEIAADVVNQAKTFFQTGLRPLINATGVILHTNLGRAPLSQETISAMQRAAEGYNNLEFDLSSGERGSRHTHIEPLLCRLSGAEAALVVNNNAAAVMLGLSALAKRREVIVSRGQAVEIGGGFRIPEVIRQSGARLVEVGTTNRTYIRDFEEAISPQTAALLRVHSSNFQVIGFSQMVTLKEIVNLGKARGIPVLDDLGSGCPLDITDFGLCHEPTIQESMAEGVDLAFFSGDKLLGGPQAGIIIGKKVLIERLKKHPLVRALRIDKIRLAGLSVTLMHYLKGEALSKIPVWQMISLPLSRIEERARRWAEAVGGNTLKGESLIGGGSLPGSVLPTLLLSLGTAGKPAFARKLADLLRQQNPPVIGRLGEGMLYLDPRTVFPDQDEVLIRVLKNALSLAGDK